MGLTDQWQREAGVRLQGTRLLDRDKVQAPCIVPLTTGGYRLFYTGAGPDKPFPTCQGCLLSAYSTDGLNFRVEAGIRLAPQSALPHMSLRVLAPTIARCKDDHWRMYFESRGPARLPTVVCSAVSTDLLHWELEDGIRLQGFRGVGGPRFLTLPDGSGRLYCFAVENGSNDGSRQRHTRQSVISALSSDGLNFEIEPGYRLRDQQTELDSAGITAAEVIAPQEPGDDWTMYYSAWQDAPPGTVVPLHPAQDTNWSTNDHHEDFAADSIAADMAGYRSRIFVARSSDGLAWERAGSVIDGTGYSGEGLDAVHAEDMSLTKLANGAYRMYYAACDNSGHWRIASAVS